MARQRAMEAWLVPGMWVESAGIAVEVFCLSQVQLMPKISESGKKTTDVTMGLVGKSQLEVGIL